MGNFICFCLGILEISIAFCIVCLGILTIAYVHSILWDVRCDKIQFIEWLKEKDIKHE